MIQIMECTDTDWKLYHKKYHPICAQLSKELNEYQIFSWKEINTSSEYPFTTACLQLHALENICSVSLDYFLFLFLVTLLIPYIGTLNYSTQTYPKTESCSIESRFHHLTSPLRGGARMSGCRCG